jgi:hypothetical protein
VVCRLVGLKTVALLAQSVWVWCFHDGCVHTQRPQKVVVAEKSQMAVAAESSSFCGVDVMWQRPDTFGY